MGQLRRRLALIVLAIAVTLTAGTLGYMLIEHYSPFEAFYTALLTVTTVGYGDTFSPHGRWFNAALILFGVIMMLLAIGAMTQIVIELELNQFFGKRRVRGMIDKLDGHVIVCGFGRVGRGAADELRKAGAKFVIVDSSDEKVEHAMKEGMLAVAADASRDDTLLDVGIERAKGLIATLSSDADNLFVVLTARALNPNMRLAARVAEQASEAKLRRAGADFVYAPYNSTGHRMAQAIVQPHLEKFLDFTARNIGLNVGIEQMEVTENCPFVEKTLAQIQAPRVTGVIVIAVRKPDGKVLFNPPAETKVLAGDHLIAMGEPDGLRRFEDLLNGVAA
jgi:voltage-gated potassium channel